MVDKVDIISAPSKYSVQPVQNINKSAKKPANSENRKVDWQTIGIAGAAIAAVIGAIILSRHSNIGKTEEVFNSASGHSTESAAGSTSGLTPPVDPEAELKKLYDEYKKKIVSGEEITFDKFKELINSKEFADIREMIQRISSDEKLFGPCKTVIEQLKTIFGNVKFASFSKLLSEPSDENILRAIVNKEHLFDCRPADIQVLDATDELILYRNETLIIPTRVQYNPSTGVVDMISKSGQKIYYTKYGRYMRLEDGYGSVKNELEYINPENITVQTPRITTVSNRYRYFRLLENGETKKFEMCFRDVTPDKMLVFEYNPETNKVISVYSKTSGEYPTETPICSYDDGELKNLAEIFKFTRLKERDYISDIKTSVSEILG